MQPDPGLIEGIDRAPPARAAGNRSRWLDQRTEHRCSAARGSTIDRGGWRRARAPRPARGAARDRQPVRTGDRCRHARAAGAARRAWLTRPACCTPIRRRSQSSRDPERRERAQETGAPARDDLGQVHARRGCPRTPCEHETCFTFLHEAGLRRARSQTTEDTATHPGRCGPTPSRLRDRERSQHGRAFDASSTAIATAVLLCSIKASSVAAASTTGPSGPG